jgi:hypothetical protein
LSFSPEAAVAPTKQTTTITGIASTMEQSVESLRASAESAASLYKRYTKPKDGGGRRSISAPSDELNALQQQVLAKILRRYSRPTDLRGVVMTDPLANARAHRGKKFILALDILNAFPSTKTATVVAALRASGFTRDAARLLTALCCDRGCLPQGAPTSNALLDMVLFQLDRSVVARCQGQAGTYTRYVDNITCSSNRPLGAIEDFIARKLRAMNYRLNAAKTQRGGLAEPVDITGVKTAATTRVRDRTLAKTAGRIRDEVEAGDGKTVEAVKGALAWVGRVNPRQARNLVRKLVPEYSDLSRSLQPRKRPRSGK